MNCGVYAIIVIIHKYKSSIYFKAFKLSALSFSFHEIIFSKIYFFYSTLIPQQINPKIYTGFLQIKVI